MPDKAIQSMLSSNGGGVTINPVELQSQLTRFSDHYLNAMNSASRMLRKDDAERPNRRSLLRRRIAVTNDVLAVATGPNAYANLLDMIILVSLNLNNLEYWMPKRYGDSAKPLLFVAQDSEKEIWRIAETALKKKNIEELRIGVKAWREQHIDKRTSRDFESFDFVIEIAKIHKTNEANKSSVFNLLMIDPFAGLDPATRELADTRLFAERGLFLARHMPTLLRLEAELLALQTVEMPQMENLLASISQLSASAERFSKVSERFPAILGSEREHIVQAIDSQRPGLISLAAQSEQALNSGKLMSEATNATLKTFQAIVKQLNDKSPDPNSEPFRMGDYTATAAQIHATAEQLTQLLKAFDNTINSAHLTALTEKIDLLSKQAETSGKVIVDYAFKKLLLLGVILIVLSSVTVLASIVVYWMLKKSLKREK
ncbi:MAG: hypothetical protein Q7U18_05715 [Methylobacter sp.]|nr:hypothetical protein [Methylobacter sp.]